MMITPLKNLKLATGAATEDWIYKCDCGWSRKQSLATIDVYLSGGRTLYVKNHINTYGWNLIKDPYGGDGIKIVGQITGKTYHACGVYK